MDPKAAPVAKWSNLFFFDTGAVGNVGKPFGPVGLQVVAIGAEILFEDGVQTFGLTIRLRVVGRGEIGADAEALEQGAPETRDELGSTVGGDGGR